MPLLAVFDDVLPDPQDYRAQALAQPFQTIVTGDETWKGIAITPADTLARLVTDRIGAAGAPRLTFFRKSPAGQQEPNFIHSDEGMGEWTAILYLNPTPADGDGTVFWRYRPTGAIAGSAREFDKDPALWEPWKQVDAVFGRLLVFDSLYFHSRAIKENYGDGDEARLIQVAFGPFVTPPARVSASVAGMREAVMADIPDLLVMGRAFRASSAYATRLPENLRAMAGLAERLIASPDGVVLVVERDGRLIGMIGVGVSENLLSGARTASELFYWMDPAHRGHGIRLLRAAERWARAQGARLMQMIAPDPTVEQLYQRMGYTPWEVAYFKEL